MSAAAEQIAVAEGLFSATDGEPHLIGSRCFVCATHTFPRQASCPKCTSTDVAEVLLPNAGTLWSWTVQRFRPKTPYLGPEPFEPYGVGYIELHGAVIVESRLTTADPRDLHIEQPMHLVIVPFRTDDNGRQIMTFAFSPGAAP